MSTLTIIQLLIPFILAFMVHDAEEVATQHKWMKKHGESLTKKLPRMKHTLEHLATLDTKSFGISVLEELVVLLIASVWVLFDGYFAAEIWSALFIGFCFHLFVHIIQSIVVRGYVPGLVTSVALFPFCYLGMLNICNMASFGEVILYGILGIAFMVVNLRFAHWFGQMI